MLARRDHGRHGQLRLHARAGAFGRAPRSSCATSSTPRTWTRTCSRPGSSGAGDVRRVPRDHRQLPKAINYASNIGHSALRTWAMGDHAFSEAATADDLSMMTSRARRRAARRRDRLHHLTEPAPRRRPTTVPSRHASPTGTRCARARRRCPTSGPGSTKVSTSRSADATDDADRERLRWSAARAHGRPRRAVHRRAARDESRRARSPRDLRPHRGRGWAHDRPGTLPRHQRAAVVPHPLALRRARRVAGDPRRWHRRAARHAPRPVAREAGRRRDARRLHEVAGHRRDATQARLGRHPRLRARLPPNPTLNEFAASARAPRPPT